MFDSFSLACLMFGVACGFVAFVEYRRERRREAKIAFIRRIVPADERPNFLESTYPWRCDQWWKVEKP